MFLENYGIMAIIDVSPYEAISIAKFHQFIAVLCRFYDLYVDGSIPLSHIRVFEDRHPFNLLFIINTDAEILYIYDMIWNKGTESFIIHGLSLETWHVRWEDHLMRNFPCLSGEFDLFSSAMSLTNDGQVLIRGREYAHNRLYVCNAHRTRIRIISFVKPVRYKLHTTFGQYLFDFVYYDPRLIDGYGTDYIDLALSEMNDFKVEPSADGTTEYEIVTTKINRFSVFITSHMPEKGNDFHLFRLTIERRLNITKHLAAEYSASDESLVDQFISNRIGRFLFQCRNDSKEAWCFLPSASEDPSKARIRERYGERPDNAVLSFWAISYYYDSDEDQLIAAFKNIFSDDSKIRVLFLH